MAKWAYRNNVPAVSTFSIVAADRQTGEIGIAVQSRFLAVGAVVPWAKAGVGAVATQSWANTSYGPRGLDLLETGMSPDEVMAALVAGDEQRDDRQAGIVSATGASATYTGSGCFDWAGGVTGPGYACQGNILAGPAVVDDMAGAFQAATGPLPERLVTALAAGQAAGGDRRGMQSAALLVVKPGGGYGGFNDRYIDLRVDEHIQPIDELGRILQLQRLYFEKTRAEDRLPLTGSVLAEVKQLLRDRGYAPSPVDAYDDATRDALRAYYMTENFDERWTEDAILDAQVLAYMRRKGN